MSLYFETVEETQKLETEIGTTGLTEMVKYETSRVINRFIWHILYDPKPN